MREVGRHSVNRARIGVSMKETLDWIAAILVIAAVYNIIRGGASVMTASANEFRLLDAEARRTGDKKLMLGVALLLASMITLLIS